MSLQYDRLGKNIRVYRVKHKLSQNSFAGMLGCTPEQLSRIENGHRKVQLGTLNSICEVLDISYEDLLLGATEAKVRSGNEVNRENWATEEFARIVSGFSEKKIRAILDICAAITRIPRH